MVAMTALCIIPPTHEETYLRKCETSISESIFNTQFQSTTQNEV